MVNKVRVEFSFVAKISVLFMLIGLGFVTKNQENFNQMVKDNNVLKTDFISFKISQNTVAFSFDKNKFNKKVTF